jgi:hypothetical protein
MTGDDAPIKVETEVTLANVWAKVMPSNGLPSEEPIDVDVEVEFD